MNAHFPDSLRIEDAGMHNGSRIFVLLESFRYISSQGVITAHKGFETDGASIPHFAWSLMDPVEGEWFRSAIIHDWLYSPSNHEFTRADADDIFKEAMFNDGVPWLTREIIYRSVRMFGWKFYRGKIK